MNIAYLLRGYNLDHGTDLETYVDGMPVNQPTKSRFRISAICCPVGRQRIAHFLWSGSQYSGILQRRDATLPSIQ